MVTTLFTLALAAMVPFESAARECPEVLSGIRELLQTGSDHRESLLSGISDPALTAAARSAAKTIKQNQTGSDLQRAILSRAATSADAAVAGQIVFGLDVLRSIDAELFAATAVGLLEDPRVRASKYLFNVVDRANFILVGEKFATPGLRLPFLRAVARHQVVREAFLRLNNAGQWLSAALATPGLIEVLDDSDLDSLCRFASELSLRRVSELRSGTIAPTLAETEWQLARKFATVVRTLSRFRSCRTTLDGAMSTLDQLGRARQFIPQP